MFFHLDCFIDSRAFSSGAPLSKNNASIRDFPFSSKHSRFSFPLKLLNRGWTSFDPGFGQSCYTFHVVRVLAITDFLFSSKHSAPIASLKLLARGWPSFGLGFGQSCYTFHVVRAPSITDFPFSSEHSLLFSAPLKLLARGWTSFGLGFGQICYIYGMRCAFMRQQIFFSHPSTVLRSRPSNC